MGLIDKIIKTRNHWFHRYDTTELVWSPQFVKDSPNAFGLRHAHLHTLRMCFSVSNLLSHVFTFVQTKQRSSEASDNEKFKDASLQAYHKNRKSSSRREIERRNNLVCVHTTRPHQIAESAIFEMSRRKENYVGKID